MQENQSKSCRLGYVCNPTSPKTTPRPPSQNGPPVIAMLGCVQPNLRGYYYWPEVRYSYTDMAPTIVRDGQFRLFFFSREEPRLHVHVSHPDGEAKFWLQPEVTLANCTGLSATQLRQANLVVNEHIKEIENAWNHHFGG